MPPQLTANTPGLDFGSVVTGTTVSLGFQLQNTGDEDAVITGWDIDTPFSASISVPITIVPNDTFTTSVEFTGGTAGTTDNGLMTIVSNDPGSPLVIGMVAHSIATGVKAISVSPSSFIFDNTKVGEDSVIQVFTVTNTGTVNVAITAPTFPAGFASAAPVPSYTVTLTPGDTMPFGVKFQPAGQGLVSGNVAVMSDAAAGDLLIAVSGNGFLITPAYIVSGPVVVLFAFGNTVLQCDSDDLNCEEVGSITRDVNMTGPGVNDSILQMQLNHEAKGVSALTWTVENQMGQIPSSAISLSAETNDKIRAAFGNMDSSLSGEVLTIKLTHALNGGPASITSYILRYVPRGEVVPT